MSLRVGVYERIDAPQAHSVLALQEQRVQSDFLRLAAARVRLRGARPQVVRSDVFLDQGGKLQTEQEDQVSSLTENPAE